MTTDAASKAWCVHLAAIIFAVAAIFVAANYFGDFYGLFRDPRGRAIRVYANERTSKYLFGYRYIPSNFDGLLIGSSYSATWDVSKIQDARVYNASLQGGNISEEKLIADNVFQRGRIKLAIFTVHPYLTASFGRKSDFMNPQEYWGALGSIGVFRVYVRILAIWSGLSQDRYDAYGTNDEFAVDPLAQFRPDDKRSGIAINEKAFEEYAQLLNLARLRGARVVGVIPPILASRYEGQRSDYDTYFARMIELFQPDEKIVNLNGPAYATLVNDPAAFYDGVHLTSKAAEFVSSELAAELKPVFSDSPGP